MCGLTKWSIAHHVTLMRDQACPEVLGDVSGDSQSHRINLAHLPRILFLVEN